MVLDIDKTNHMDIVMVAPDQPAVQLLINRPGSGDFSGDTQTVRVPPGELGPFHGIDALQGTMRESHKSGADTGTDGYAAVSVVFPRPKAVTDGVASPCSCSRRMAASSSTSCRTRSGRRARRWSAARARRRATQPSRVRDRPQPRRL